MSKQAGGILSHQGKVSLFVLFKPLMEWVGPTLGPTHIGEGQLLYSIHQLKY